MQAVSERLFYGEKLLFRALPRWGASSVCEYVADLLDGTAVVVSGRKFTESSQKVLRQALDVDLSEVARRAGSAQLIFDDYGHAVRRSQGGALHSLLYRLLIDGDLARDLGALFVARSNDDLNPGFAGSPILSRTAVLTLPRLSTADAEQLGLVLSEARHRFGDSTWLARRMLNKSMQEAEVQIAEHLDSDRRSIVQAMPIRAVQVVRGAMPVGEVGALVQEVLRFLGSVEEQKFTLASAISGSSLADEIMSHSPGWPPSRSESVARFVDLMAGAGDALWVDRYALSSPAEMRSFLEMVRKQTNVHIDILVSRDTDRPRLDSDIASALDGLSGVEVRFMHPSDRADLHDRHLVMPSLGSGSVIPTAGVILSIDRPGSAVSVPFQVLPINYAGYWSRGTRVYPLSA